MLSFVCVLSDTEQIRETLRKGLEFNTKAALPPINNQRQSHERPQWVFLPHTNTHTHTLVLVQLIPKASPGQLPPMCVMTHRTTNIWTVLAIVSKILAQHGGLSLMCLLLFCRSLFSSTESGNSSVLGVVKYFSVHFLHVMLNVPYQTSWIILLFFSLGFSGVGRTVWRVRAQRPSFHTSWYERDSWRVSI